MGTKAASDRRRLVSEHLDFVRAIASKVKDGLPGDVELDDLVAYGTQGLLEAAGRFDDTQGAAFTTFAYYRIRGAIVDGVRRMGALPRAEYARGRDRERALARLEQRASDYLGELAAHDRAAPERDDRPSLEDELRRLASALRGVASVVLTSLEEGDEEALADDAPPPEELLARATTLRSVRAIVPTLPPRERRLLELHYFQEKSFDETAAALGVSKSWLSRLHARAIDQVQARLAGLEGAAAAPVAAPAPPRKRAARRR